MANILCIGISDATMETRRMILERAGHTVTQARDLRQVIGACTRENVALAILGQMLPQKEKLRVVDVIRGNCTKAKILELHTSIAPELATADAHLHVAAGAPEGLAECVAKLTARSKRRGA